MIKIEPWLILIQYFGSIKQINQFDIKIILRILNVIKYATSFTFLRRDDFSRECQLDPIQKSNRIRKHLKAFHSATVLSTKFGSTTVILCNHTMKKSLKKNCTRF